MHKIVITPKNEEEEQLVRQFLVEQKIKAKYLGDEPEDRSYSKTYQKPDEQYEVVEEMLAKYATPDNFTGIDPSTWQRARRDEWE